MAAAAAAAAGPDKEEAGRSAPSGNQPDSNPAAATAADPQTAKTTTTASSAFQATNGSGIRDPAAAPEKHGEDEDAAGTRPDANPNHSSSSSVSADANADAGANATARAPEDERTRVETAVVVAALASALFLAALDVTIVTVAVPTISREFRNTAGYTWIGSAYMLTAAASSPVWGKISDIWGRKPVMLVAAAVFWLGSLLGAVSTGMGMLIAARAIQGVGGGGIVILVNVCISDLFSMRRRGECVFGVLLLCRVRAFLERVC